MADDRLKIIGTRVRAEIPGGVTVEGPILRWYPQVFNGDTLWLVVENVTDCERYDVREDEVTDIL